VQNWQQVSDRLADIKLGAGRRPTIRYWPEQATSTDADTSEHSIDDQSILSLRKGTRSNKLWGRYWLTADTVLEDNVRIEWGQLLEVHRGERENDIDCSLYVLIQKGGTQFAGKLVPLKNGIRNQLLYNSGDFMEELISILLGVRNRALRDFPELKEQLDGL